MGNSEKDIKNAIEEIVKILENLDWIKVNYLDKVIEKDSGFVDVDIELNSFIDLFRLVWWMAPTYIEIYHPKEFKISALELQEGLTMLSQRLLNLTVAYFMEKLKK